MESARVAWCCFKVSMKVSGAYGFNGLSWGFVLSGSVSKYITYVHAFFCSRQTYIRCTHVYVTVCACVFAALQAHLYKVVSLSNYFFIRLDPSVR